MVGGDVRSTVTTRQSLLVQCGDGGAGPGVERRVDGEGIYIYLQFVTKVCTYLQFVTGSCTYLQPVSGAVGALGSSSNADNKSS